MQNLFNAKGAEAQEAETDAFECGKCKQRKCRYYQKQTRSADEPMTTFVTCTNCNNKVGWETASNTRKAELELTLATSPPSSVEILLDLCHGHRRKSRKSARGVEAVLYNIVDLSYGADVRRGWTFGPWKKDRRPPSYCTTSVQNTFSLVSTARHWRGANKPYFKKMAKKRAKTST